LLEEREVWEVVMCMCILQLSSIPDLEGVQATRQYEPPANVASAGSGSAAAGGGATGSAPAPPSGSAPSSAAPQPSSQSAAAAAEPIPPPQAAARKIRVDCRCYY